MKLSWTALHNSRQGNARLVNAACLCGAVPKTNPCAFEEHSLLHLWIGEYQRRSLPKVFVAHMEEDVPSLSEKCLVTAFYARKAIILQSFNQGCGSGYFVNCFRFHTYRFRFRFQQNPDSNRAWALSHLWICWQAWLSKPAAYDLQGHITS